MLIDKCWFKDLSRVKDIEKKIILDGKDEGGGAVAMFKQLKKQPLLLGGPQER